MILKDPALLHGYTNISKDYETYNSGVMHESFHNKFNDIIPDPDQI